MKIKLKPSKVKPLNLLVAAAGTGGHIMPAIAVAQEFIKNGQKVAWVGTISGMENKLVDKTEVDYKAINIGGFRGKKIKNLITYPFKFVIASFEILIYLLRNKVKNILVFGGYISLPVAAAGIILRKNIYIHEQNFIFGTSNKLLAPFAKEIFTAFKIKTKHKITVTGNPIRENITPKNKINKITNKLNLLIVGGSLGANVFNEKLPKILLKINKFNIVHQCGRGKINTIDEAYKKKAKIVEFIDNVNDHYKWADFVIARSGAMTIAELEHVGLPAIFVPYTYAIDNHQYKNAEYCQSKGGALICEEKDLSESLESILKLLTKTKCKIMAKSMKSNQHKKSTETIFSLIKKNEK